MYDLLKWLRNPNWQSSHLEGNAQDGTHVIQYCYDTGKNLIFTKTTQKRYPWDVKSYDQNFICDWITEHTWQDPRSFKAYNPPVPLMPRFWDGDQHWAHAVVNAVVDLWSNCSPAKLGENQIHCTLTGPFTYDFGGNIGTLPTIRCNYQWSPVDKEYLHMTQQHGWIRWSHLSLKNTVWIEDQYSNHNWVTPGTIVPDFPCFQIP